MASSARQRGESLLSLLLGLGLGLLVVAAGIRLLGLQWQSQRQQWQHLALQQDLQAALDLMVQELQQAQHLPHAWLARADGPCSDALCTGDGALQIAPGQVEFATDRNRNGLRENNECSGFRLRNGALQHKTACQPAVWTVVTDSASLPLTGLTFRLECWPQGRRVLRRVHVQLDVRPPDPVSSIADVPQLTLTQSLNLRNDLPWPGEGSGCPST